jgi:phospholipid/cholesterol/gamma-HCH transport system substrate-binding protein
MNSKQRNVLVGLVVMLALGMLTFMLLLFAGRATALFVTRGVPITLDADRADGLNEGAPILFRGVIVGQVTRIRRSENNEQVILSAEVDTTPPLPGNLTAQIKTAGALSTGAEITLEQTGDGSNAATLAPQAVIPATYVGFTLLPPELTDLANQIRRDNLVAHLDQSVIAIGTQVAKAGKVLDSMQAFIGDPKMRENVQISIANIRRFSDNLQTLETNANGTIVDMHATVNRTSGHIDDLSRNLDGSVQKLGAVLDQFQTAAAKINNGQGTAGLLINDPRLYNSLADTSKELDQTIADLQRLVQQW